MTEPLFRATADAVEPIGLQPEGQHATGTNPDDRVGDRHERRDTLERERLRVQAEIVSYPMPIPACDVYFNGLLEQRASICEQLAMLDREERSGAL
jgi:hypothetical protein